MEPGRIWARASQLSCVRRSSCIVTMPLAPAACWLARQVSGYDVSETSEGEVVELSSWADESRAQRSGMRTRQRIL